MLRNRMSWLLGMLLAAVPADAGTPPISPVLAIRPNTVAVSGGQALLTVRNTAEGVIPTGFQFRFVFDAPLGGVTVATATPIVRSALLVPADFAVAGRRASVSSSSPPTARCPGTPWRS